MNEQEAQELIVDYAAGLLDGDQKRAIERYLSQPTVGGSEPDAKSSLEEMRQTLAKLPLALPQVQPPLEAFAKLSARIDAVNMITQQSNKADRSWFWPSIWSGVLAASLAVVVMLGRVEAERGRSRNVADELYRARSELAAVNNHASVLQTQLRQAQQQVNFLHSRQLVQVELKGTPESPTPTGRLLVDLDQKAWRFFGTNLSNPGPGKHYEFWLVTADNRKIPMGEVELDGKGLGSVGSTVPNPLPSLAAAALSIEAGPAQSSGPQGPVVMLGSFH